MSYFVHDSAIVEEGCEIGNNSSIWHFSHLMGRVKIGERCSLGQNVFVADDVVLGNNVKVQNNVSIYSGVICEDDVFLGPSCVFTNIINPRSAVPRRGQYLKTRIKKGASIGANATIICGNSIGLYAFIGAGAVVTKDVPDFALVIGNPGQQVGWMSEFGHRLRFNGKGEARCVESNQKYELINNTVQRIE